MITFTNNEQTAVADAFLEFILADPELLEGEFASVVTAFLASPPQAPPANTTHCRPPGSPAPLPSKHRQFHSVPWPRVYAWQSQVARSPPPRGFFLIRRRPTRGRPLDSGRIEAARINEPAGRT
jgi:hypothetical protein